MEEKINVAAILKDKPEGTKLWTDMFGSVTLYVVTDACDAFQVKHHNKEPWFDKEGKLCKEGVLCIYPSKSMRYWSKFAWKKGDLLVNSCGFQCIFKEWASDDYTKFNGCYSNSRDGYEDVSNAETAKFDKLHHNIAYGYVREIERKLGGKLNLETLEIEKAQTEFKDGDIVYAGSDGFHYPSIHILNINGDTKRYYARLVINGRYDESIEYDIPAFDNENPNRLRLATEAEKKQLFDALAKEGKAWDSEKKTIVNLKPKIELKPFDKVLVRDFKDQAWQVSLFGYKDANNYYCCNGSCWNQCIPYIGNESLLGTTKDVEG